jgi:large subunit ribosomal protein L13
MKTVYVKQEEANRAWFIIDAAGKPMGRVAAKVAYMLRGKHKPCYAPHQELGDYVIVINAEKAVMTGRKAENKMYHHHTGFPGGLKSYSYNTLLAKHPVAPLETAIRGMLPKGPLGRKMYLNAKVYAGDQHPHAAQKPVAIEL